ncbi:DNA polymerase epsilon, subunit B [Testicularia cyperi]|uniref:DNA polymerase epsilon subunit n=1 Tax=Testicularia cyperi TaxID=1882483 RepID=A0A317XVH6_9BASI|nr:DNA polymerase epsilon, subunit B [Testicularia cyperi]
MPTAQPVTTPELRRCILRIFTTKHALQLHSSAIAFITSTLASHGLLDQPHEWEEAIEALASGIVESQAEADVEGTSSSASSEVVTAAALEKVYSALVVAESAVQTRAGGPSTSHGAGTLHHHHELTDGEKPDPDRYFAVVDAFKQPKLSFDASRKVFERCSVQSTLLPVASQKSAYMRERLQIVKSVIERNENFCPPLAIGGNGKRDRDSFMKLTSTKNLLGRQGQRFLLFGILSTSSDGRYELEDLDGVVGLDLQDAIPGEGIFTEGSLILVEGEYTDEERIRVFAIGHPPSENRAAARQIHAHADVLGTGAIAIKDEKAYKLHEEQHDDLCFVIISDLHLDHPKTLTNLRAMLQGYTDADFLPYAFILCGNFSSTPWTGADMITKYQAAFASLADVLAMFPAIVRTSHFVMVPGPNDPFSTPLVPRPGLPDLFTAKLRSRLGSRLHVASNPCRISYFSQEIVIYRDDVMARMLRNTVSLKEEAAEADLKKYLVSTLLDQAHLCPLPQRVRPVLWDYDHTLRLYPMPTALVLADSYDRFELTYEGCHVFNPGSFRGSSFGWTTYYPATARTERR